MKKILMIFGTRPEAIKMAPLVKKLPDCSDIFDLKVCVTAQHRQMLDQVLQIFNIQPDYDLNIMKKSQALDDVMAGVLLGLKKVFVDCRPDLILVHGDTTTAFAAGLSAFYQKITVGHIEAGLRTNDIYAPWPEEINRQLITRIAKYHFAPTRSAKDNLLKENVPADRIIITGNTVIDALMLIIEQLKSNPVLENAFRIRIKNSGYEINKRRFILVTGHRRENFGQGFINICNAIQKIAGTNPDLDIVYTAHLNPNVLLIINRLLSGIKNVYIIKPLEYDLFIYLMSKCYLILTDSGGIQEEAPSLGKPVLVMRSVTERPEAVEAGTVKLVGTKPDKIILETHKLLNDPAEYQKTATAHNPYGDGKACFRIVRFLAEIYRAEK